MTINRMAIGGVTIIQKDYNQNDYNHSNYKPHD